MRDFLVLVKCFKVYIIFEISLFGYVGVVGYLVNWINLCFRVFKSW